MGVIVSPCIINVIDNITCKVGVIVGGSGLIRNAWGDVAIQNDPKNIGYNNNNINYYYYYYYYYYIIKKKKNNKCYYC
jgi:hypothetical protein